MSIAIQSILFPVNPADVLRPGHEARLIATIIHNVVKDDLIKDQLPGRPIVGKKIMCGVLVWAYLHKIYSSRKIEDKISTDAAYMYLSGGRDINFRTICVFRSNHTELIQSSLAAVIFCSMELNIRQVGEEIMPAASKAKKDELRKRKNSDNASAAAKTIIQKSIAGEDMHRRIKNIYSLDSTVLTDAIIAAASMFDLN